MSGEPASGLAAAGIVEDPRRRLSYSQLNVFQDCGEKYRLSYVEKVPREPQGAFLGGIAVHDAIATSEAEGWWSDEDAASGPEAPIVAAFLEKFRRSVEEAGGPEAVRWGGRGGGENQPWWEKQGEFMLRRYGATRRAMDEAGWGPIEGGVEMRVLDEIGGTPVVGYLDKFLMHEMGEPAIVDYKTGRVGNASPTQFATYALLLERSRGIVVRRGIGIFLRAQEAAKRVQPVEFAGLVERMDELFAGLVEDIQAERFRVNPHAYCSSCSVRAHCWYWRATSREGDEA